MDSDFQPLRCLIFYSYGNTSCSATLIESKKFNNLYIRLAKESKFTKDGEEQHKTNYVLYTIPAAEAVIGIITELVKNAKQYKGMR
jgi:hypothetical protein